MKALEILAKRLAFGFAAAWGVLTLVFLLFSLTNDWVARQIEAQIVWRNSAPGGDTSKEERQELVEEALAEYTASRGLDRPLHERYFDWMRRMVTLDWGESLSGGDAVFPLVTGAARRTAMYVVPAVVLAVVVGLLLGLYLALKPESRLANGGRVGSYLLFGVPSFWLGGVYVGAVQSGIVGYNEFLAQHVLPTVLVTTTLVGGYVSYSRAYALEHVSSEFIKLVKSKGAGPALVAKHVVRNAAIPLFSMLFTEALGLLVLSIFVIETVLGIDGFGMMFFSAIEARDIPVLLGSTMVIIAVGILGNIIQDISYQYLDPRVEDSE
jgi:peptide/nickel transport system permease protein